MPTSGVSARCDIAETRRALSLILEPGQVAELRVLNTRRGTVSGYFDDFEKLALAAATWSGKVPGVYLTLNPVNADLLARAHNRVREFARETTSDVDILARRWLPLDFDAVRPAGISSTDAEHIAALDKAQECRGYLRAEGWPDPILADSGNGGHLLYGVALPKDDASRRVIASCLKALAFRFDDQAVHVDQGNFNAARIWKLYGTAVCKGDSLPKRPHRLARILDAPTLEPVLHLQLEALAATVPAPPPPLRSPRGGYGQPLDLDAFIARHNIDVAFEKTWNGARCLVLRVCPFSQDHNDRSAVSIQWPGGALAFRCHHNGCIGKGWPELRQLLEPGAIPHERPKGAAFKRGGRVYLPRVEVTL